VFDLDLIEVSFGDTTVLCATAPDRCFAATLAIDWLYDLQQQLVSFPSALIVPFDASDVIVLVTRSLLDRNRTM
jgi:hypothetical protein